MDDSQRPLLLGKQIWTYDSKPSTPNEIGRFLRKYELNSALKLTGQVSNRHSFGTDVNPLPLLGVPVANGILAYTAMRLIEESNDYRRSEMAVSDLVDALKMYFGLELVSEEPKDTLSYLVRLGASQFDYDSSIRHLVPRTLLLYGQLWSKVDKANSIDVLAVIEQMSGLDLKLLIAFGFTYTSNAKKGFVRSLTAKQLNSFNGASEAKALAFIEYVSGTYQQFRELSRSEIVPAPHLEPFRSNPLQWYPLLIPDRQPFRSQPDVYLCPIPTLILKRVTGGLYTALSEHFRGEGSNNNFRAAFGYVFEAYIGRLIEKSLIEGDVRGEVAYSVVRSSDKMSTDWMILEGDKLVIIEVKQAGLRRGTKAWGDINAVAQDLVKTLGKAVKQLFLFESDIQSGDFPALGFLENVKAVERLVITHDQLHFNNWILQEQIREGLRQSAHLELPPNYTFHIASIEDFETIVASCGASLFDFLKAKSQHQTFVEFDFREYFAHSGVVAHENAYLDAVNDDFMSDMSSRTNDSRRR